MENRTLRFESLSADRLKNGKRIKNLCLDVNPKYVAVGCNTGSINVYDNANLSLVRIVSVDNNKDARKQDPVVKVRFSPRWPSVLAFATSRSSVLIVNCHLSQRQFTPLTLARVTEHTHQPLPHQPAEDASTSSIVSLVWNEQSSMLFSADSSGRVFITELISLKKAKHRKTTSMSNRARSSSISSTSSASASGLGSTPNSRSSSVDVNASSIVFSSFYSPSRSSVATPRLADVNPRKVRTRLFYRSADPIVQVDFQLDTLIISSTTGVVTIASGSEVVTQVGKTPRSGLFGACFDPNSNGQQLLSARKGRRLWVADAHSGQVLSTIKFSDLSYSLLREFSPNFSSPASEDALGGAAVPKALKKECSLRYLTPWLNCVVSWGSRALIIMQVAEAQIHQWHLDLGTIVDFASCDDQCFVLHDPPPEKRRNSTATTSSPSITSRGGNAPDSSVSTTSASAPASLTRAASQDGASTLNSNGHLFPSLEVSRIRALSPAQHADVHLSDNQVLKAIHVVIDNALASQSLLERIRSALLNYPDLAKQVHNDPHLSSCLDELEEKARIASAEEKSSAAAGGGRGASAVATVHEIIEPLRNEEFAPAEVQLLTPLKKKEEEREQQQQQRAETGREQPAGEQSDAAAVSASMNGELRKAAPTDDGDVGGANVVAESVAISDSSIRNGAPSQELTSGSSTTSGPSAVNGGDLSPDSEGTMRQPDGQHLSDFAVPGQAPSSRDGPSEGKLSDGANSNHAANDEQQAAATDSAVAASKDAAFDSSPSASSASAVTPAQQLSPPSSHGSLSSQASSVGSDEQSTNSAKLASYWDKSVAWSRSVSSKVSKATKEAVSKAAEVTVAAAASAQNSMRNEKENVPAAAHAESANALESNSTSTPNEHDGAEMDGPVKDSAVPSSREGDQTSAAAAAARRQTPSKKRRGDLGSTHSSEFPAAAMSEVAASLSQAADVDHPTSSPSSSSRPPSHSSPRLSARALKEHADRRQAPPSSSKSASSSSSKLSSKNLAAFLRHVSSPLSQERLRAASPSLSSEKPPSVAEEEALPPESRLDTLSALPPSQAPPASSPGIAAASALTRHRRSPSSTLSAGGDRRPLPLLRERDDEDAASVISSDGSTSTTYSVASTTFSADSRSVKSLSLASGLRLASTPRKHDGPWMDAASLGGIPKSARRRRKGRKTKTLNKQRRPRKRRTAKFVEIDSEERSPEKRPDTVRHDVEHEISPLTPLTPTSRDGEDDDEDSGESAAPLRTSADHPPTPYAATASSTGTPTTSFSRTPASSRTPAASFSRTPAISRTPAKTSLAQSETKSRGVTVKASQKSSVSQPKAAATATTAPSLGLTTSDHLDGNTLVEVLVPSSSPSLSESHLSTSTSETHPTSVSSQHPSLSSSSLILASASSSGEFKPPPVVIAAASAVSVHDALAADRKASSALPTSSMSSDQATDNSAVVAERLPKRNGGVDRAPTAESKTSSSSSSTTAHESRHQLPLALSLYIHGILEAEIRDHAPSANLSKLNNLFHRSFAPSSRLSTLLTRWHEEFRNAAATKSDAPHSSTMFTSGVTKDAGAAERNGDRLSDPAAAASTSTSGQLLDAALLDVVHANGVSNRSIFSRLFVCFLLRTAIDDHREQFDEQRCLTFVNECRHALDFRIVFAFFNEMRFELCPKFHRISQQMKVNSNFYSSEIDGLLLAHDGRGALRQIARLNDPLLTNRYLDSLLSIASTETCRYAASVYPDVNPHYVAQILKRSVVASMSIDEESRNAKNFASYFEQLMDAHGSHCKLEADLVHEYIGALLSTGDPNEEFLFSHGTHAGEGGGGDRKPALGAHTQSWRYEDALLKIVDRDSGYSFDRGVVLDEFMRRGFFVGAHALLTRDESPHTWRSSVERSISLAILTDDAQTLRRVMIEHADAAHWTHLLHEIYDVHGPNCENFSITPASMVHLMIQCIGPKRSVKQLFSEVRPECLASLPADFYATFHSASSVHRKQKAISNEISGIIDGQLHHRRSSFQPPRMKGSDRASFLSRVSQVVRVPKLDDSKEEPSKLHRATASVASSSSHPSRSLHVSQRENQEAHQNSIDRENFEVFFKTPLRRRDAPLLRQTSSSFSSNSHREESPLCATCSLSVSDVVRLYRRGGDGGSDAAGTLASSRLFPLPSSSQMRLTSSFDSEKSSPPLRFPCGHTFHEACLPGAACLVCLRRNLSSFA